MRDAEPNAPTAGPSPSELSLWRQTRRVLASRAACPSPCVSVCRMSDDTGLCAGCWRSLDEIAVWGRVDDAARRVVWQRIATRLQTTFPGHFA